MKNLLPVKFYLKYWVCYVYIWFSNKIVKSPILKIWVLDYLMNMPLWYLRNFEIGLHENTYY